MEYSYKEKRDKSSQIEIFIASIFVKLCDVIVKYTNMF